MPNKAKDRQSSRHKGKYSKYQTRSTCTTCRIVFKSPKHRFAHIESGHKTLVGQSSDKAVREYTPIFVK